MFLINSNIKRALCLVIFSTVVSSNVSSISSDKKVTPNSTARKVFNYLGQSGCVGTTGFAAAFGVCSGFNEMCEKLSVFKGAGKLNFLNKWFCNEKAAIPFLVISTAAGLALGAKIQYEAEKVKAKAVSMQEQIEQLESELVAQRLDESVAQ